MSPSCSRSNSIDSRGSQFRDQINGRSPRKDASEDKGSQKGSQENGDADEGHTFHHRKVDDLLQDESRGVDNQGLNNTNIENNSGEGKPRARKNWDFVRRLQKFHSESQRNIFKTGERSSLTTSEATFLSMIAKSKLDTDHNEYVQDHTNSPCSAESEALRLTGINSNQADKASNGDNDNGGSTRKKRSVGSGSHFVHLVTAAVVKERLRGSISERLSHLSGPEAKFLTSLVNNDNVSLEALKNAAHVLDNDPLYNPSLRAADSDDENLAKESYDFSGTLPEKNKENLERMNSRDHHRRKASHFETNMWKYSQGDKCQDFGIDATSTIASAEEKDNRENKPHRRPRRRSSQLEKDMWKFSQGGGEQNFSIDATITSTASAEEKQCGERKHHCRPRRRSSQFEKDTWKYFQGGEELNFSVDTTSTAVDASDDKQYEDMEKASLTDDSREKQHVRLFDDKDREKLMSTKKSHAKTSPTSTLVEQNKIDIRDEKNEHGELREKEGHRVKYYETTLDKPVKYAKNILSSSFFCCGIESFPLGINEIAEGNNIKQKDQSPEDIEAASLEAKKRYLHIKNSVTMDRHDHISTWIGSPEDYPILGLRKPQTNNFPEEENDPLDPHVLSPLLMKCLRDHLPYAMREENFWLRYSLVRDGASLEVIFSELRHSQHTILAIETVQGEVFGSFTSSPWRSNGNNFYGSCEAFVWMLRKTRRNMNGEENCHSLDEYILRESSLDVFHWDAKGGNRNVQLSNPRKLFVGGGNPDEEVAKQVDASCHTSEFCQATNVSTDKNESLAQEENHTGELEQELKWGMALALDKDLIYGTSSRCATFNSSPLIDRARHEGSEIFEVMNLEIWALTPCMTEELAENLELGRTFVMGNYK